ncbi:MAG: hypothetical protein P8X53_13595, partial [Chromatiales bacterium]
MQRIAERIGRSLERSGLITRDIENAYLAFDPAEEAPINSLLGASITYRIARARERARRCLPCRRCRRSLTSRAERWPRVPVSRCTRASRRRPRSGTAAAKQAKACSEPGVTDRQRSLTWAQRLKRVFAIDIEVCRRCGGRLRVIASIE